MEGYTENGAGTDVTDQIGFAGMRRKKKQRRGLSVFQLKVIGAVALVLSAGSTTLVPLIFGSDTSNMTSLTAMCYAKWCRGSPRRSTRGCWCKASSRRAIAWHTACSCCCWH